MRLALALAVVFAALFTALIVRASFADTQAESLCRALVTIVSEGDQALDEIAYYRQPEHADELAAAHDRNRRLLILLACEPLPPAAAQ